MQTCVYFGLVLQILINWLLNYKYFTFLFTVGGGGHLDLFQKGGMGAQAWKYLPILGVIWAEKGT